MGYRVDPNAKNVWVRDIDDTEDLPLAVNASSVYFNSGKTMEQEFGKGAMLSNIATVDGGMEKVIDGTYDGAYESCKMYGRSLVNLATTHSLTFETVWQSKNVESLQLTGGTKYLIMFELNKDDLELTLSQRRDHDFVSHLKKGFTMGLNKTLVTLDSQANGIRFQVGGEAFDSTIQNIMLIKYQEGMEHWGLNYFTGLCDVKAPILKNVGKNLFNYNDVPQGSIIWNTSNNVNIFQDVWYEELTYGFRLKECIKVKPNTRYYTNFPYSMHVMKYRANGDLIKNQWNGVGTGYFTTTSDTHYINLYPSGGVNANWNEEKRQLFRECFIYEGDTIPTYEDYKTNILETSNEVILRGLPNGVRDTYDCLTGEYIRRVEERDYQESDESDSNVITDLVKTHYELAEPTITMIEPSTTPFAYENGHIILESGHEGQSLLPTLEYQTVVSRSGQVAMIDKTIQQHECKITLLEKMLVQNIIDIEYKNTLLALKLEIDEVI